MMTIRHRLAAVAVLLGLQLTLVVPAATPAAAAQETSTTTTSTTEPTQTTTTPTTATAPPTTLSDETPPPPPWPSCEDVLAAPTRPVIPGDTISISVPRLPASAKLDVVLHHQDPSNGYDVRNCFSVKSGGRTEVLTQDLGGLFCGECLGDVTFTIRLRATPPPGSTFCEQQVLRTIFANGGPPDTEWTIGPTNRVCRVMPASTGGGQGQLPFTGAGPMVPLLVVGAAMLALGTVLLLGVRHSRAASTD
jgi:hypothetical protein